MEQNQLDKREVRRKRRKRNQLLAYITVILFVFLLSVGIVFGVNHITHTAKEQEDEQQEMVDAMLGTEETIAVPTEPEETVVELTPEQKLDEIVNAGIEVMPLEDKVAGLFIVTPEAITGVTTAIQAGDAEAAYRYSLEHTQEIKAIYLGIKGITSAEEPEK